VVEKLTNCLACFLISGRRTFDNKCFLDPDRVQTVEDELGNILICFGYLKRGLLGKEWWGVVCHTLQVARGRNLPDSSFETRATSTEVLLELDTVGLAVATMVGS
jgi:hypothetical protein